jgi:hypothetical protein
LRIAKKIEKKHCARLFPCLKRRQRLAGKGGEIELKFLKAIMIVAVLAGALSLGACAQHKETTTGAATTGYSK